MSQFLQDISFHYSSISLPWGGGFACKFEKGEVVLNYSSSGDLTKEVSFEVWQINLTESEKQTLAAALWAIMDQEPLAEETAMIEDGCPTGLTIEYKGKKIEHRWNSFSDHACITQFSNLIGNLCSKPHTKRKLRPLPDVIEK